MKNKFLQGFVFGFALFLGSILGYLALFAALDWINIPTVTSETPLTSTLWNDAMNTIKGNVQDLDNRVNQLESSKIPTGTIAIFSITTCPTGWLETNGASVSTTTYASLFSAIGYIYGGSGGNFSLPDYRGQFLRAWSHGSAIDLEAPRRTNRGDGTTGDNVGTKQGYEIQSHNHGKSAYLTGNGSGWGYTNILHGSNNSGADGNWETGFNGGSETRPKNINVLYCIKY